MSPCLANIVPNPSLRLQAILEEIPQAYISSMDSAHKQYQNDLIEIRTNNSPKEIRA